jgi:hypothetical protein
MRFPNQQAKFFRLCADVLYYLASGNSHVFHMTKDESNPYYRKAIGLDVTEPDACAKLKIETPDG